MDLQLLFQINLFGATTVGRTARTPQVLCTLVPIALSVTRTIPVSLLLSYLLYQEASEIDGIGPDLAVNSGFYSQIRGDNRNASKYLNHSLESSHAVFRCADRIHGGRS